MLAGGIEKAELPFLRTENGELRTAYRAVPDPTPSLAGEPKAGFQIHQARADQFRDLAIEVLHTFIFAGLDRVQQRAARPLACFDAIASARVGISEFRLRQRGHRHRLAYQPLRMM